MGKLCLCVAVAMLWASFLSAQGATVLVVYKNGSSIDTVDPNSGATITSTPLTVVGGGVIHGFNGMTQDPTTGTLYGAVRMAAAPTNDYSLCTIDRLGGTITVLGAFGNSVADIQFDQAGTLFAVTGDDGTPAQALFSVNKFTGALTQLYQLSDGGAGESLGFDRGEPGFMRHWSGTGSTAQGAVYESIELGTGTLNPFAITGVTTGVALLSLSYDSQTASFWAGTNTGVYGLLGFSSFTPTGTLTGEAEGMVRLPRLNPQTSMVNLGTVVEGNAGTPEVFVVNGFNLFSAGQITAPSGVEISFTDTSGYGIELFPNPSANGLLSNTSIYVRIADYASSGPINDVVTLTSLGGDVLTVQVVGHVDPSVVFAEMDVFDAQNIPVTSGSIVFGGTFSTTGTGLVTYTIENNGNFTLQLTSQDIVEVSAGSNVVILLVTTPAVFIPAAGSSTFSVEFALLTAGTFDFTISIPNSDADENPYSWQVVGDGIGPEIEVWRGTFELTSGTPETLSSQPIGPFVLTYSIKNTGLEPLVVSGTSVAFELNCSITVTTPAGAAIGPGDATTMEITVSPTASGSFEFALLVSSNDSDESSFVVAAVGTASSASDNDGGGGGDDEGCAAGTRTGATWLTLLAALSAGALARRVRRSRG